VGDGAVGTAVAVAFFGKYRNIFLAGPPEVTPKKSLFSVKGVYNSEALIEHIPITIIPDSVDCVVLALKAFDIEDVVPVLAELNNCKFICLSNGMGFDNYLKNLSVEYAVLSMGFNRQSYSTINTSRGSLFCKIGSEIAGIFKNSSIPVVEVPDIAEYRWCKWYANSIINPIAALTGLANNQLLESGLKDLIAGLSVELEKLMPSEKTILQGKQLLNWLLENSTNKCSMLQDLEKGNSTEIDYLTGLAVNNLPGRCPTALNLVTLIKAKEFTASKIYSSNSPI